VHDTLDTITSNATWPVQRAQEPRCRICSSRLEHTFIDLGMSPLCESFLTAGQLDRMEAYYPLHARVCEECFLVQLQSCVSPEHIFSESTCFASYSTSRVEHARSYCHMVKERLRLGPDSLAVELSSNDGYLLQHFLPLGVPVLGIEPCANAAETARRRDVPTLVEFFGTALAERLVAEGKCADLVIANNVLAQVPDLNGFVAGMKLLLAREGVITLEFPHLQRLIADNQFDTIHHEHCSYFSLVTVDRLAESQGLKIIDVERLATHGGSLRVYLAHAASARRPSSRVSELLEREIETGFLEIDTYARFPEQVRRTRRNLLSFLIAAKEQGKHICGYGALGQGNTLLSTCGIGTDFLDFIVDRNPYRHGRFTAGTHVPIGPVEAIDAAKPDYVLILHRNLKEEITRQMRHIGGWGGRLLVAVPEVQVIEPIRSVS
jgi:C-methyltransferase C-terminal domain/Putative zinc binding domain/Methyltransferase domain